MRVAIELCIATAKGALVTGVFLAMMYVRSFKYSDERFLVVGTAGYAVAIGVGIAAILISLKLALRDLHLLDDLKTGELAEKIRELDSDAKGRSERSARNGLREKSAAARAQPPPTHGDHVRRLGISFGQWEQLKRYLLDLQAGNSPEVPAGLSDHPVVKLARQGKLDKAVRVLVGGRSAWIALWKS